MNEQLFANKICQVLDRASTRVNPGIAERLRAARERALEARRLERAPALAWAGNVLGGSEGSSLWLRLVLPALLVMASVAGIYTWQQNQRLAEIEEIDAELLTDDLPIDAYLDRGFEAWLKKRAAR